ncbi:hypothetical protein D3C80_2099870 [compost metagenome]
MKIPSLKGESLRDAMELLSVLQVSVKGQGAGYVVDQTSTEENGQRVVTLILEPPAENENAEGSNSSTVPEDETGESP